MACVSSFKCSKDEGTSADRPPGFFPPGRGGLGSSVQMKENPFFLPLSVPDRSALFRLSPEGLPIQPLMHQIRLQRMLETHFLA